MPNIRSVLKEIKSSGDRKNSGNTERNPNRGHLTRLICITGVVFGWAASVACILAACDVLARIDVTNAVVTFRDWTQEGRPLSASSGLFQFPRGQRFVSNYSRAQHVLNFALMIPLTAINEASRTSYAIA